MPTHPFGRSLSDFEELKDLEKKLLKCCRSGKECVIANERPGADANTAANTVRAGFLRFLILGGDEDNPVHERGVHIRGAWIQDELDLEGIASTGDVSVEHCWFEQTPNFIRSRIAGALTLDGSRVPGLQGDRLTCNGGMFLQKPFLSDREVRLLGATIFGDLACAGGTFKASPGDDGLDALCAEGVQVSGLVDLRDGFSATGRVSLHSARIQGGLTCSAGHFANRTQDGKGVALDMQYAEIGSGVNLRRGFMAEGRVSLFGAKIRGNLDCSTGHFANSAPAGDKPAISGQNCEIYGNLIIHKAFVEGPVFFNDAKIGGNIYCRDSQLLNYEAKGWRIALSLVNTTIIAECDFSRSSFVGVVSVWGAAVGRDFNCSKAKFVSPSPGFADSWPALDATNLKTGGDLTLTDTNVIGKLVFEHAEITGSLQWDGLIFSTIIRTHWSTLQDGKVSSKAAEWCYKDLSARPQSKANRKPDTRLVLAHAKIGTALQAHGLQAEVPLLIDMSAARAHTLDDPQFPAGWGNASSDDGEVTKPPTTIDLDGFVYQRIEDFPRKYNWKKIPWFSQQYVSSPGDFYPQPWLQLRRVMREEGRARDARQIGVEFEKRRRKCGQISRYAWIFHVLYGFFTGYGYRPMKLFGSSVVVWLFCGLFYYHAACLGVFKPTNFAVYEDPLCRYQLAMSDQASTSNPVYAPPCTGYPVFSPLVYSLNVFLPVVQLGEEAAWTPNTEPFSPVWWHNLTQPFTKSGFGNLVQLVIWLETLFGWIAGLLLVAVVSGLARKQDES